MATILYNLLALLVVAGANETKKDQREEHIPLCGHVRIPTKFITAVEEDVFEGFLFVNRFSFFPGLCRSFRLVGVLSGSTHIM